MNQPVELIK